MVSRLRGPELVQLKNSATEDFDESNWRELGALTGHLDEVENHPRLLRSLGFGDPDYDGLALVFLRKMIGANDENLNLVQNYVAKKCQNSGEDVSSVPALGRKIVFAPTVFSIPTEPQNPKLVSVMMPFSQSFGNVYTAISNASKESGFLCMRSDDIWNSSTVIQDVFSLIFQSFIVICDFTGKNPNVFYEAGIAHTLGKHVIPITQSEQDIPFDLRHHRYARYLNNSEGVETLKQDIYSRLVTLDGMRGYSSGL